MTIALRGTATGSVGATPRTVSLPTGTIQGDTLYLQVVMALDAAVVTVPSGFTLVTGAEVTGVTNKTQIYSKVAGASEPSSYSISWTGGGNGQVGLISLLSDFTLVADGVNTANSAVANTNKTWNSVSPATTNTFLMCFGTFVNAASTPDAAMTERWDVTSASMQIYLMTQSLSASGATGTRTATGTSTANQRTITLAVSESGFANQARITNAGVYVETNIPAVVDITNAGVYVAAQGDDDAPWIAAHVENSRTISLIWVDNGTPGDTYELQHSLNNVDWEVLDAAAPERTTYTYIHRNLQPLSTHYYKVRRVLSSVNGTWSSTETKTTNNPLVIRNFWFTDAAASPVTVNVISGADITAGDMLLLHVVTADAITPTVPAGFTLIANSEQTGTLSNRVYWKIATISEPTTYQVSASSGIVGAGIIAIYSDTTQVLTINDSASQANGSGDRLFPSVTSSVLANMLTLFASVNSSSTTTVGSGVTEVRDNGTSPRTWAGYLLRSTSGATGTFTGTGTAQTNKTASVLVTESSAGVVPTAPSGLTATVYSDTRIDLSWTDNSSNEAGFQIFRSSPSVPTYTLIATTLPGITTYTDTGLSPFVTYSYKIQAFNDVGASTLTSVASDTTVGIQIRGLTAPTEVVASTRSVNKPSGVVAGDLMIMAVYYGDTITSLPLGFTSIADITGGIGRLTLLSKIATAHEPSSYSITFSSVAASDVGIIAFYSLGNYQLTVEDVVTKANPASFDHPSGAIVTSRESILCYFKTGTGVVGNTPDPLMVERWDTTAGTHVTYLQTQVIKAFGALGTRTTTAASNTYTSNVVTLAVIEDTAASIPSAPSGLTATAYDDSRIDLDWADTTDADYYEIYRATIAAPTYTYIGEAYPGASNYSDTGLTPVTQYSYKVVAVNILGTSSFSSIATATTPSVIILRNIALNDQGNTTPSPFIANGPTGMSVDDFMLMHVTYSGSSAVFSTPSGWTLVNSIAATASTLGVIVYSKIVGASEPSTYSVSWTGAATVNIDIIAWYSYSGYDLVVDDSATNSPASSTNRVFPSVNVSGLAAQMNMFAASNGNSTPDSRSTEQWDHNLFVRSYCMTEKIIATGATGTRTATGTNNTNRMISVAIKEVSIVQPNPPSGLTATPISTSQINLTWTDNSSDEDNFVIERSPNGSTGWTVINSPAANVTSYSNTGLTANTAYYYRIQAVNSAGGSAYSTANTTTLDNPPTAPSGLTATAISSSRIDLNWTDNSSNETSFEVERSLDGSTGWSGINTTAANATSYSNTGLTANTIYYYRVRAHNSGGYSSYTSVANATTLDVAPTAPSGLTATAVSSSQIDLAWTDNSSNETDFSIERSPNGTSSWTVINTTAADAISYSNTGLTVNTTYYYRVRAHNAIGNSAYTSVANATTFNLVPNAPTVLIANVISSTEIDISWTDNSSNETSFKIDRSLDGVSWTIDYATVAPNVVSYHNTGLTDNTTYYYRVRAHNALGDSVYTNTVSGTTPLAPPTAPSSLTATTISDIYIQLNWTDNSHNEEHFIVERSLTGVGGWSQIASLPPNTVSYVSGGLVGSTTFYYRVKATNTAGSSAYSNIDSDTTLAGRIYYKFSNVAQTTTLPS